MNVVKFRQGERMEVRGKEDKSSGQDADGNWPRGRIAPENSVQIKAYYWLPPYVSGFARRRRMEGLIRMLKITLGTRVLDLGGSPDIWENVSVPLDITNLEPPGGDPATQLDPLNARTSIHTFHSSRATRATSINSPTVPST